MRTLTYQLGCTLLCVTTCLFANAYAHTITPNVKSMVQQKQSVDLAEVFALAQHHDLTYKQALATYYAAKLNVPIQRATLLPTVKLTANSTLTNTHTTGTVPYNSHGYGLEIDQSIFNMTNWKTLSQKQVALKKDAIALASAKQALVVSKQPLAGRAVR